MSAADQPAIVTARLALRPPAAADAGDIERLAGVREIADMTKSIPHPYPPGHAARWIASLREAFEEDRSVTFAITLRADGTLVGNIGLRIDRPNRRGVLGYWIGVSFWNCGYASEAAAAVLAYGFDALALHRIEASFLSVNPASGRVMAKLGMQYEGKYRDDVWKNGKPLDTEQYAILARDPRPLRD